MTSRLLLCWILLLAGPGAHAETLGPDLVRAVGNVMGVSHLLQSSHTFCGAARPAAMPAYTAVVQRWEQRNAKVLIKKARVMSADGQELVAAAMATDMGRKTDDMIRPMKEASAAEKVKWCDKAFADIDRGLLDLVGKPSIEPLMRYPQK